MMDALTREQFGIPAQRRCDCLEVHDPWAGVEPRSYNLLATAQGYPQRRPHLRFNPVTFVVWSRGLRGRAWRSYEVRAPSEGGEHVNEETST